MAEERIDIEVTDKVDANAAKKINQIADAADRGFTYVEKLKAALASVNTSSVDKLVSAMARADSAQAKLLNAQVRLTQAQDTGALAAAKLATQQQKLATEQARTEAATARAAAASSSAEAAAIRLAAAQQRTTAAAASAGTAEEQLAADTAALSARFAAGEINIRAYVNELQRINGAAASASTASQQIASATDRASAAATRYQGAARQTSHVNANIIAQMQDIGVSLAGGQNPLLVMIQQGSQLSYIATTMEGGMKALLGTMVRLLAPFTLLAAAVGGLYLGFKNFTNDIAAEHKPELEAYANSLGLTSKEMRKLQNETVGANGKLKEMDVLTITTADSWNGFWETVKEGLSGMSGQWDAVVSYIKPLWDAAMRFMYLAFVGFYGLVVGGMRAIVKTIINLPTVASETAKSIANVTLASIEWLANKTIDAINWVAQKANTVTSYIGVQFGELDHISLGRLERQGMNLADVFGSEVGNAVREADRTITAFGQRWEANSVEAARNRIKGLADAIQQNRNPGRTRQPGREEKTQAEYINETNNALDNELSRMRMLRDEREVQQKLDQIEQEYLRRRMPLDQAQLDVFRQKIQAIQDYKYVQQQADRVMEDINGPARTYAATQQALNELLARGAITQEQFAQQTVLADRAMAQATDPLFQMKEAMDTAMLATRNYGVEVERAAYYEQIRQAMLAKGIQLSPTYVAGVNAEADALMRKNDQLMRQQFIQSQLAGVLDPILNAQREIDSQAAVYAELDRLRQVDLINEDAYQQAKAALWVKYNEQKLQASSDFFGALADVTKKGTGVVGAISKAAAVAEATIQGYLAVQRALASMPPPFNYVAAAAVAIKTGANVAGILSTNAGSFATGGQFMVEGRSGVDANNINMNVTRGERVTVETPKQQRENDAANNGSGEPPVLNAKIINSLDPRIALDAVDTAEGEQLIVNIITRNSAAVKRVLG